MSLEIEKIEAYYQPIVDLKTNEYKKYEALLRYPDQENENNYFFPFDEFEKMKKDNTENYFKCTIKMLSHVIETLKQNEYIEISLNICYLDIETKERREKLLELIGQSAVASRLVLEFTEEEELKDKESVRQFMREAKKLGCMFALDDFGKGHATFDPLLSFDFDYLKLDKVLVENFTLEPRKYYILDMIVNMAKRLDIKVIAEYIEENQDEMYESIRYIGCDYGQGYYFGKAEKELKVLDN